MTTIPWRRPSKQQPEQGRPREETGEQDGQIVIPGLDVLERSGVETLEVMFQEKLLTKNISRFARKLLHTKGYGDNASGYNGQPPLAPKPA